MSFKGDFKTDKCLEALHRFKDSMLKQTGVLKGRAREALERASFEINLAAGKAKGACGRLGETAGQFWEVHVAPQVASWNKQFVLSAGAVILSGLVVGGAVLLTGTDVYKVTADGTILGYVSEEEIVDQAVESVKSDLAKEAGVGTILIEEEKLTVEPTDLSKRDVSFLDAEALEMKLAKTELCKAEGWALRVGDSDLVVTTTEENAEQILDDVKKLYLTEGSEVISSEIKEDVDVTKSAVLLSELKDVEEAVEYIATGREEAVAYTVGQGESLWTIASDHDMSPYELMALNPEIDPAKLMVGQQISLTEFVPFLTVVTKEKVTAQEAIPYETVYEASSELNRGVTRVKTEGVEGTKENVSELVKENGKVVGNTLLASNVVKEPQQEVALQGTKGKSSYGGVTYVSSIASANYGSGVNLTRPVPVNVSSSFNASRGNRRHTGVDLRNPQGTPIVAAAAGTVTVADYRGSCGLMVKIDHGNGMETWYEHCSTVSVTPGQKVSAGQSIATVGKTGNATGYILHFEVRINGVPQNPLNFL